VSAAPPDQPVFFYDFSSPFAYLAAVRIDDLLPGADWRPIVFGVLLREIGRVPWSLRPGRETGMREVEERAARRGLPPVRWPEGWPAESYSVAPLRAALVAQDHDRLREFSHATYGLAFAEGRRLDDLDTVLEAAGAAGLDAAEVRAGMESPAVRERLRANTAAALERGVTGIPTTVVGDELFWGDDRLEAAAAAAGGAERGGDRGG
jgi:2-hydroxychromene-2-carboxylate isomerase